MAILPSNLDLERSESVISKSVMLDSLWRDVGRDG